MRARRSTPLAVASLLALVGAVALLVRADAQQGSPEHGAAQVAPAPGVQAPEWTAPDGGAVQVAVAPGVQAPESAVTEPPRVL